jgi:hypothetical protein
LNKEFGQANKGPTMGARKEAFLSLSPEGNQLVSKIFELIKNDDSKSNFLILGFLIHEFAIAIAL